MKIYDIKDIPDSSPRLFEIIQYAAKGWEQKDIAEAMHIEESTVKSHVVRAYRNYNAVNMTHLVGMCFRAGIL